MKPIAIVTGASSGLGKAIGEALTKTHVVLNWSLETSIDVRDEVTIALHAQNTFEMYGKIDVLVNCAGINHIEWLTATTLKDFNNVMATNVSGIFLTAKHLVHCLQGGTICNIISTASVVPMTASIAYNASKAAAAMMTRQMARELFATHNITVFGVSPGLMADTAMTERTYEELMRVRGWSSMETASRLYSGGKPTTSVAVAKFTAFLLDNPHKHLNGCIMEYGQ